MSPGSARKGSLHSLKTIQNLIIVVSRCIANGESTCSSRGRLDAVGVVVYVLICNLGFALPGTISPFGNGSGLLWSEDNPSSQEQYLKNNAWRQADSPRNF